MRHRICGLALAGVVALAGFALAEEKPAKVRGKTPAELAGFPRTTRRKSAGRGEWLEKAYGKAAARGGAHAHRHRQRLADGAGRRVVRALRDSLYLGLAGPSPRGQGRQHRAEAVPRRGRPVRPAGPQPGRAHHAPTTSTGRIAASICSRRPWSIGSSPRSTPSETARSPRKRWLAFFKTAAKGKDHLTPEDLQEALFPKTMSASFSAGDAPTQEVLLRGLFAGEIGSLNEGPGVNRNGPGLHPEDARRQAERAAVELAGLAAGRPGLRQPGGGGGAVALDAAEEQRLGHLRLQGRRAGAGPGDVAAGASARRDGRGEEAVIRRAKSEASGGREPAGGCPHRRAHA